MICDCPDFKNIVKNHSVFKQDEVYGWLISWLNLTEEKGYTQVHKYGIGISFCPFCGNVLMGVKE